MRRRINLSQLKSHLRQAQSKQRQAISRYNQGVRDRKRAIDNYNRQVRTYNARQRSNQQRLRSELSRLNRQSSTQYVTFRASVSQLNTTYARLDQSVSSRSLTPEENFFLDLSEREAANSVGVLNDLLDPASGTVESASLQQTTITDEIAVISEDLDSRWHGALYSLNPGNPEASRHFCSSAREIFAGILDQRAPDDAVGAFIPNCPRTDQGVPTRRSKIQFLLEGKGVKNDDLVEFVEADVENIIELFNVLNAGTHGPAGKYDLLTLASIKTRVEDGLVFLARIAA